MWTYYDIKLGIDVDDFAGVFVDDRQRRDPLGDELVDGRDERCVAGRRGDVAKRPDLQLLQRLLHETRQR